MTPSLPLLQPGPRERHEGPVRLPGTPTLEVRGLSKRYANGVLACDQVSLQLQPGEVHAVLGENGAGKSTLLKLLYGLIAPDAGTLLLDGQPCRFRSPADALAAGVGLVPQHLQLLPSMTVAENIVLGAEPVRGLRFDRAAAVAAAQRAMQQHGLPLDAGTRVGTLSAGQQQRVAILKALHRGARLLLLDEPTALLTPQESQALFSSLRELAGQGLTVLLISHKMAEVREASDRFTVLRAGRVVGGGVSRLLAPAELAALMMGRAVEALPAAHINARGRPARLALRELTVLRPGSRPALDRVTLDIAGGEILGVAGVEGNGQSELADVLGGLRRPSFGSLQLDDAPLQAGRVRALRRRGLGRIGEDRLHDGMAPNLSIAENLAVLDYSMQPVSRWGRLDRVFLARRAREAIQQQGVVAAGEHQPMGALSGGNMQKLVFARELAAQPRCLVANQPTRGVDVGAAQRLHRQLLSLRDAGAAVLLFSADIDELLVLADRLVVIFEGRLVAHLAADAVSPRTLGLYMTGALGQGPVEARLASPFTPGITAGTMAGVAAGMSAAVVAGEPLHGDPS
ncbi:ABC transporter ATP-binding protein [Aquabacterium sp.]|uniref:ABC transporter ATP-binding protein n=1 Tax=Aquabacterium sp. TaxID=1872578 RepID=UPI002BD18F7E|nr:ABC transporter ATP-binding protein [Aquabacterium sp.]HSW04077.1 ABC transporter ATP-binding protein [Aquabacterium sp.]